MKGIKIFEENDYINDNNINYNYKDEIKIYIIIDN